MRKRMKVIFPVLLLLMSAGLPATASAQDVKKTEEAVIGALKSGNGQIIAEYLNEMCDLDVPQYKGTYSKAQAGRIISDFLRDHSLSGFSMVRQGQVGAKEWYTMAEMKDGSQTFRIYFVVKDKDGKSVVPLFRINKQ